MTSVARGAAHRFSLGLAWLHQEIALSSSRSLHSTTPGFVVTALRCAYKTSKPAFLFSVLCECAENATTEEKMLSYEEKVRALTDPIVGHA